MPMKQPGTDKGERGETGEREPKKAKASDSSGERKERMVAGVAMGMKDSLGARDGKHAGKHEGDVGEFNEGRKESVCYHHSRTAYKGENKESE